MRGDRTFRCGTGRWCSVEAPRTWRRIAVIGSSRLAAVSVTGEDGMTQERGARGSYGHGVDKLDRARAREYALLATLLARGPDNGLIGRLASLQGDATPLGMAHAALAE